jgi:4-amino-4-deoxy-L-arabinose transferase-like glycosyltransferase
MTMKLKALLPGALIAAWAVIIAGAFFATTGSIVAPTSGFFLNILFLLLIGYLAHFSGFRVLRALARRLCPAGGDGDPLERTAIEFGLGVGLLIAAMFVLGLLGLYQKAVAHGLLLVLLVGRHDIFWAGLRERFRTEAFERPRGGLLGLSVALVGGMTLLASLAPVTAQDALVYHLAVPSKYIEAGGIRYIPESFFAQFPGNVEMLFTLALLLRGPSLAGACHWLLGAAAVLSIAALARRLASGFDSSIRNPQSAIRNSLKPGLLAAAIFATVPTVAALAGCAYIDLAVVLFEVLSTLAFLRWWEAGESSIAPPGTPPRTGWLVLAGVFAGLAAGTKYTGGAQGLFIAAAALTEGALRRRRAAEAFQAAAIAGLVSAAIASPWWAKNLVYTGNPLFPFLYRIFGGNDWDAGRAEVLSMFLKNWGGASEGLLGFLLLPFTITLSSRFFSMDRFDGMIGPAFLIGVPLVLLAAWKALPGGRGGKAVSAADTSRAPGSSPHLVIALSIAHGALWLILSRQIRFLLPAIALWAALIEAALPAALEPGKWRAITSLALRLGVAFDVLVIATNFAAHNPVPVVLGLEPEALYLDRELPGGDYAVFAFIEKELPASSRVLFGGLGNPGFLCKRPYHADALFENRTLAEILREGKDPEGVRAEFARRGFTHLLFRWDLVFDPSGRRSEIPVEDQRLLAVSLNRHGSLLVTASGTYLYRLEDRR